MTNGRTFFDESKYFMNKYLEFIFLVTSEFQCVYTEARNLISVFSVPELPRAVHSTFQYIHTYSEQLS